MTRIVALHTVLAEGSEADYERVHEQIPAEVASALRGAGVHEWRIWRSGRHLFHLVEVDDYRAMRRALADLPANLAWQATVAPFMEVADDYAGDDDGIAEVWRLTSQ